MKRIFAFIISFVLIAVSPVYARAYEVPLTAQSAILIDSVSGEVIYEKNADEKMYPASMTKMMVMLMCMEKISSGEMDYGDKVTVTSEATSLGGTQLFLETGEVRTVEELLYGVAVESANDAATALGIHISGSVNAFAEEMNRRAGELGMTGTHFVNACGLHEDEHYTTSRDMAVLSRELLKHEDIFKYISTWTKDVYIGKDNSLHRSLANTNKLISRYDHIDGIKTGFTEEAGHCMAATGKIGNTRLIAVVMRSENSEKRFDDAMALLDYGFANYEGSFAVKKGKSYGSVKVINGVTDSVSLIAREDFYSFGEKGTAGLSVRTVISREILYAPVKAGEVLGSVEIYDGENLIGTVDLVAKEDVVKCSLWEYLWRVRGIWL